MAGRLGKDWNYRQQLAKKLLARELSLEALVEALRDETLNEDDVAIFCSEADRRLAKDEGLQMVKVYLSIDKWPTSGKINTHVI